MGYARFEPVTGFEANTTLNTRFHIGPYISPVRAIRIVSG